jgi:hypothetical protein
VAKFKRLVATWAQVGNDERQCTFDYNVPSGIDAEADIEAAFDTLWSNLKHYATGNVTLTEFRWYGAEPNPPAVGGDWGDTFRVIGRNVPGDAQTMLTGVAPNLLPPQVAVVVTERLPAEFVRHQGRFYLPIGIANMLDGGGRITTAVVDDITARCVTFYNAAITAGYMPSVIGSAGGVRAVYPVQELRVNNNWDIQRRRGFEQHTYQKITAINAP